MAVLLLSACSLLSGAAYLWWKLKRQGWPVIAFKAGATLCLVAIPFVLMPAQGRLYQTAVIAGLVCSTFGDILLALPRRAFVAGMLAFSLAHVSYIYAFTRIAPLGLNALAVPVLIYTSATVAYLWPHLGRLRPAVAVYAVLISLTVYTAWNGWVVARSSPALAAATGASLFVVSDTFTSVRRFVGDRVAWQILGTATYLPAQWLIALSCGLR